MVSPLAAAHAAAPACRRRRASRPQLTTPLSPRRRGSVSVLAMLYLMIFAALALGFYAQTNLASHVSENELRAAKAMAAAESGMEFIRLQLTRVKAAYLPENQMLVELAEELNRLMDATGNLNHPTLGIQEVGMSDAGDAILIPRDANAVIPLAHGGGFRVKITRSGRSFVVKVVGTSGRTTAGTGKGIEYVFEPKQVKAPLFEYGVAGRGPVEMSGNAVIRGGSNPAFGSILSTTDYIPAVYVSGTGPIISGEVFLRNRTNYSYSAGSIINNGTSSAHKASSTKAIPPPPPEWAHLSEWPDFPKIDTAIYLPYVKRTYNSSSGLTLKNIRIPANLGTAASPFTFPSGTRIEGVCYVEAPNNLTFASDLSIRGVIVGPNQPAGTLTTNIINFAGQATAYDISTISSVYDMTLAANKAEFPPALLALKGASVLAPGFHVKFSGGYASVSGSIVSDQLTFSGGAGGNITGWVMGLANQKLTISGMGSVQIERPGSDQWPAGMFFRSSYTPRKGTYREFPPRSEGM